MNNNLQQRGQAISDSMLKVAPEDFAAIKHLGIVVRLTVEFREFLEHTDSGDRRSQQCSESVIDDVPTDGSVQDTLYAIQSTFSGIEAFQLLSSEYSVLIGSLRSSIVAGCLSASSVEEMCRSLYKKFDDESNFMRKTAILLDLFKLQIVFAGLYYDWD